MPALAAALPAISMGIGGVQTLAGVMGLLGNQRDDYEIPDSVKQAMAMAQMRVADPKAPGYDQAKSNIDLQTANALNQAVQTGSGTEALASVVGAQDQAYRGLAEMSARSQDMDLDRLQQSLQMYANYEDQEFQMNEYAPYAQKFQLFSDMVGGGLENIYQGMDRSLLTQQGGSTQPGRQVPPLAPLPMISPSPQSQNIQSPFADRLTPEQLQQMISLLSKI
jgi:hypothetical protein